MTMEWFSKTSRTKIELLMATSTIVKFNHKEAALSIKKNIKVRVREKLRSKMERVVLELIIWLMLVHQS